MFEGDGDAISAPSSKEEALEKLREQYVQGLMSKWSNQLLETLFRTLAENAVSLIRTRSADFIMAVGKKPDMPHT